MTREELIAWATRHGLTVVPTMRFNAICAAAAESIAAAADLDADLAALLGR